MDATLQVNILYNLCNKKLKLIDKQHLNFLVQLLYK